MSIERHEIEKLATLARIAIDDSTINEVSERLGSVLELVDQLASRRYQRCRAYVTSHASHPAPARR